MAEESPGTTVGNLNQRIADVEAALAAEQRCNSSRICYSQTLPLQLAWACEQIVRLIRDFRQK